MVATVFAPADAAAAAAAESLLSLLSFSCFCFDTIRFDLSYVARIAHTFIVSHFECVQIQNKHNHGPTPGFLSTKMIDTIYYVILWCMGIVNTDRK